MDPFAPYPHLLIALHRHAEDNRSPHPDCEREMVAWSPETHRSSIARSTAHAFGTLLVRVGSRLQRPAPVPETDASII